MTNNTTAPTTNVVTTNKKYTSETNEDKSFTIKDIPPPPTDISKIPKEEREETPKDHDQDDPTIIPISRTRKEYEKVGITYPGNEQYDRRERHHRLTSGNWKRRVTRISWIRDIDNEEFIDWNEIRTGKTAMQRTIIESVEHVTQYEVPIPAQKVEFDAEMEEYKTVTAERPQSTEIRYSVPFSKKILEKLLHDTVNRTTEYTIGEENGRTYHVTKKELQNAGGDFEKLYNKKSGSNKEHGI